MGTSSQTPNIKPTNQQTKSDTQKNANKSNGKPKKTIRKRTLHSTNKQTDARLPGLTASSAELLARVKASVDAIAAGKSITIVDGVGYPAVGSVVGCSNAAVAKAAGASALVVGKEGVGNAIDSFNLCASFYEHAAVPVLGGIFNRLTEGKESDRTKKYVPKYFATQRSVTTLSFSYLSPSPPATGPTDCALRGRGGVPFTYQWEKRSKTRADVRSNNDVITLPGRSRKRTRSCQSALRSKHPTIMPRQAPPTLATSQRLRRLRTCKPSNLATKQSLRCAAPWSTRSWPAG